MTPPHVDLTHETALSLMCQAKQAFDITSEKHTLAQLQ